VPPVNRMKLSGRGRRFALELVLPHGGAILEVKRTADRQLMGSVSRFSWEP
jgi:hypothetical protein